MKMASVSNPTSRPIRNLGIAGCRKHAPILLSLIRPLLPLLLPPIHLLPELPVVKQSRKRHEQAKDKKELRVRLLVHHMLMVTYRIVEDVIVEAFLVIQNVILDKVCYPFGEGPVLLRLCGFALEMRFDEILGNMEIRREVLGRGHTRIVLDGVDGAVGKGIPRAP